MTHELIPFFIILAVIFVVFFLRQEKKRKERLQAWAQRNNWTLQPGKVKDLDRKHPGIKLFDRGHSRSGDNVITGKFKGLPVTCMDYNYTTGHGKNRQTHRHGVIVLEVGHPLIPLQIRRENAMDRVGEFLGADDIDFESAEFSRAFFVKSADKKWAYDVIHSRTMEYLMGIPRYFSIEFGTQEIVVHKSSRSEPEQYEKAVALARDFYDLIPTYVMEQLKGK